jgi:hypothetical protein
MKDSFFIHHLIKKHYILFWQKNFESTILKNYPTQIYQYHFYIKKLNRWGKYQERILVITNKVILF